MRIGVDWDRGIRRRGRRGGSCMSILHLLRIGLLCLRGSRGIHLRTTVNERFVGGGCEGDVLFGFANGKRE